MPTNQPRIIKNIHPPTDSRKRPKLAVETKVKLARKKKKKMEKISRKINRKD